MEQGELKNIGYRQHFYGQDCSSDTKQCFHCKYGQVMETDREKVQCTRWNMVINEDDVCDYFDFATYWAFDYTDEDRERRRIKLENAKKNSKEGCYIATAIYGGYDQPKVLILRRYRDEVLMKTLIGRIFVKSYYFISPCLAEKLRNGSHINSIVRRILDKIIKKLENSCTKI